MRDYPMTDVIASREYTLEGDSQPAPVYVEIGKPAPMPDMQDWYCPFTIRRVGETRLSWAGGVDSLQALLMALSALNSLLKHHAKGGKLNFVDGAPGPGIHLV